MTEKLNRCYWQSMPATSGDPFEFASAISGFLSPDDAGASGGLQYAYIAENGSPPTQWEIGIGTYAASSGVLSRTTVISSSNSDLAVTFSAAPKIRMGVLLAADFSPLALTQKAESIGPELITDESQWQTDDGDLPSLGWSVSGGTLSFTSIVGSNSVYYVAATEPGQYYKAFLDISSSGGTIEAFIGDQFSGPQSDSFVMIGSATDDMEKIIIIEPSVDFVGTVVVSVKNYSYGDSFVIKDRSGKTALIVRAGDESPDDPAVMEITGNGGILFKPRDLFGIQDQESQANSWFSRNDALEDQFYTLPEASGDIVVIGAPVNEVWKFLATADDGEINLVDRDPNDIFTLQFLDLAVGSTASVNLYATLITSGGTAGVEPFGIGEGNLTGQRKVISLSTQTTAGDIPSLDVSKIIDATGVQPTSIEFNNASDELFLEWQRWQDGNAGKWIILGASSGVVTM